MVNLVQVEINDRNWFTGLCLAPDASFAEPASATSCILILERAHLRLSCIVKRSPPRTSSSSPTPSSLADAVTGCIPRLYHAVLPVIEISTAHSDVAQSTETLAIFLLRRVFHINARPEPCCLSIDHVCCGYAVIAAYEFLPWLRFVATARIARRNIAHAYA